LQRSRPGIAVQETAIAATSMVVLARIGLGPERGSIALGRQELGQIDGCSERLTFDNRIAQVHTLVAQHLVLASILNHKHVLRRGATLARR
jgi:hypothetical protein